MVSVLFPPIHALGMFDKNPYGGNEVDTTAKSGLWSGLSPFLLDAAKYGSKNFENLWQYHKVYSEFLNKSTNLPDDAWYAWRYEGFHNLRAVRYPMGKGRIPAYSFWYGQRLSYVEARKKIYIPIYAKLVEKTVAYKSLSSLYVSTYAGGVHLTLRDYDAYDHVVLGRTLKEVVNDPKRKMGHAFVLVMMLTGCLQECLSG